MRALAMQDRIAEARRRGSFMLTTILLLIALAQSAPLATSALVYRGREGRLHVPIPRVDDEVRIDGVLDEAAWQHAAHLNDFSTYAPLDGSPSARATDVAVFYSGAAIHFGVRAEADRKAIRATLARRDQLDTEDQIRIFLSTFDDRRQAFYFAVNPLGIQADGVLVEGTTARAGGYEGLATGRGTPDLSPDYVFQSKGRVIGDGYEIEVRIPFNVLRFSLAARQSWGLHVTRVEQSKGSEDSWVPARRAASSFLAQAGTLDGLTDIRRGPVLDLTPEVTAAAAGAPGPAGWRYAAQRPSAGLNLRWGVTPTLTLSGALNPDFSQTEADASQVQYDPRLAVLYPEKRTFFLDGLELFTTPNQLIYTRRIVDPVAAAKLFGKLGDTSLGFVSAVDARVPSASSPRYTLVRVERSFPAQSYLGLILTDKRDGSDSNLVAGADARVAWGGIWNLSGQMAMSRTESAGRIFSGPLLQAGLERNGGRYGFSLLATSIGDDFRAESGFIARPSVTKAVLDQRWTFFGSRRSRLASLSTDVVVSGLWRTADVRNLRGPLERKLNVNNNAVFRNGWRLGGTVAFQRFDFDELLYRGYGLLDPPGAVLPFTGTPYIHNLNWVVTLGTPRYSRLSASILQLWGRDENFFEWSPANIDYLDALVDYRPTPRLRLEQSYHLQYFQRRTDGTTVGARHIPRLKLEYQLSRATFLRAVGEYTSDFQDDLRDDGRTELPVVIRNEATGRYDRALGYDRSQLRLDFLFSYQPAPGTVLFVGYGSLLGADASFAQRLRREHDQFFFKFSYLFRP